MTAIEPNWAALLWFCLVWAVACVAFLVVAGMFPLRAGTRGIGAVLILGNAALLAVLVASAAVFGYAQLRLTSLIVTSGLIFLFAPAAFQAWPDSWRDGRSGLAVLLGLQLAAIALLYRVAPAELFAAFPSTSPS